MACAHPKQFLIVELVVELVETLSRQSADTHKENLYPWENLQIGV